MQETANFTRQMGAWSGSFGKSYTDRNMSTLKGLDRTYKNNYNITRTELNDLFLGNMGKDIKILEVGSNVGNQLLLLQKMGFQKLYGIEINNYAVEVAKKRTKNINIILGSAFDIPFKDGYFDLVFTSGVLIHIAPADIKSVMKEIYRCTKRYIWGFEYYNDVYTDVEYRNHNELLWKGDFSKMYLGLYDDLRLIKEKRLKYIDSENIDTMFLIEKGRKQKKGVKG